jgi:hypothetical protein
MPLFITDYPTQVTASAGQPVYVTGTLSTTPSGIQTVSMSSFPAGTITVSQSNMPAGTMTVSGTYNVGINGTVTVSQSNMPAGTMAVSQTNMPAGVMTVSQSNMPAGTMTVSGNYGVTVNSGSVGATQVGTWTVTQGNAGSQAQAWYTKEVRSTITTVTAVTVTTASTVVLASSASRIGATVFNPSPSANVFLALGQTPTTSLYTVKLGPGGYYEVPENFTGAVNGIVASSSQSVNVTDMA